jgi:hypothetical protein
MVMKGFLFTALLAFFAMVPGAATPAEAASLYMDPAFGTLLRGDEIAVAVRLDTDEAEEECINAVDGIISYSADIVPVDISIGDSIFSMWVEQPTINTEARTITFAGGIPNGYCGRIPGDPRLTNTLIKMIFRSPGFIVGGNASATKAEIRFLPETTAYLNDGFGTKAPLALYGSEIDLAATAGPEIQDPWREAVVTDTIPPQEFSVSIERDTFAFGGDYFIVFNTTDKQTGIDQYQVMEEPLSKLAAFDWGRADAPWVTARSPYVLEDQTLNSIIRVKAIDKAGNEYIATVTPDEAMRGVAREYIVAGALAVGLLILLSGILGWIYVRRRRTAKALIDASN